MKAKLLAQVPYADGQSFDFYEDRLVVEENVFLYKDIDGYGYLLTNRSQSINYVPVANSTSYELNIFCNGQKFAYSKSANNAMLFKSQKQRTVNVIYSELVKCFSACIAPFVFEKQLDAYAKNGYLDIAGLSLDGEVLVKKSLFGQKELNIEDYNGTTLSAGWVNVYGPNRKIFYRCPLTARNAPLMKPILDSIYNSVLAK